MQHFNTKKFLQIFAMIMVLVMTLGCFTACGNNSNKANEDGSNGGTNSNTITYEWNGLHYSLSKNFKDTGIGGDQYGSYSNDTLILTVADDTTPDGVTDSQSYANHYKNQISSAGSVSVASANGVYYTVVDYGDGTMEARGFYVDGDHCWVMYITSYDYVQHSSTIVSIITSGTIGALGGNNGGSNNPSNPNNPNYDDNPGVNGNGGSTNNPNHPDTPSPDLPTPGNKNQHSFDGLTYYLSKEYSASNNGSHMMHSNGSTAIMVISGKAPGGVADAKAFAQLYIGDMAESDFTCKLDSANGVPYTVTEWGDGTTEVRAFYLYNGYGWNIYATSYDYSSESQELINYVTSGVIDKNYQHNTEGGGSSGNTSPNSPVNPGTSNNPNNDPKPGISQRPDTNESTLISIYTLAPSSWGTLQCWAWKDGGDNVFDAWPGETMLWIGKFYASNVPSWVDHVIINGNNGETKTEDILIKPGKNVWIIIHSDGQNYSVLYTYPTNAELKSMGY